MTSGDAERLDDFIAAAKARGVSDEFAVTLLKQNGWSERRIYAAFSAYYERQLGAPVPSRGARLEYASEAFLYLLAFISLSFWLRRFGRSSIRSSIATFPTSLNTRSRTSGRRSRCNWPRSSSPSPFSFG